MRNYLLSSIAASKLRDVLADQDVTSYPASVDTMSNRVEAVLVGSNIDTYTWNGTLQQNDGTGLSSFADGVVLYSPDSTLVEGSWTLAIEGGNNSDGVPVFTVGTQPPAPFTPSSSLGYIQADTVEFTSGTNTYVFSGGLTISAAGYYLLSYVLPVSVSVTSGFVSFITQLQNYTSGGYLGAYTSLYYPVPTASSYMQTFLTSPTVLYYQSTATSQLITVWYDALVSGTASVTFGGSGGYVQAIQIA